MNAIKLLIGLIIGFQFCFVATANTIHEKGSLDFTIDFHSRLQCTDFESGTRIEIAWPRTNEGGQAVKLAQAIKKRLNLTTLLSAVSSQIKCKDFHSIPQGTLPAKISFKRTRYVAYEITYEDPRWYIGENLVMSVTIGDYQRSLIAPPSLNTDIEIGSKGLVWTQSNEYWITPFQSGEAPMLDPKNGSLFEGL